MAEDRFANIFTADLTMSGVGALTFSELNFGISLRDRIAIVIDQLFFFPTTGSLLEFTTVGDNLVFGISVSDQVTDLADWGDRRILYSSKLERFDFGTAASGTHLITPIRVDFAPPLISLPNRIYFGLDATGLASAARMILRMHFRTVKITQDQQLIEILESFQLSS